MTLLISFLLVCQTAWIRVNDEILSVELAVTRGEHYKGLMGRTELSDREGMLFICEKPHIMSFWMKGTKIPLSIGFFDENQILLSIRKMSIPKRTEQHPEVYRCDQPALYALEVPEGWFERHGVKPGMRFDWMNKNR